MHEQPRARQWAPWAAAAVLSVVVGITAYTIGAEHSAAGQAITGSWVHHRHGFFPFGSLLAFFGVILALRLAFGGRGWCGHRRVAGPGGAWYDDPARWDEWHRRAHEHLKDGHDSGR